MAEAMPEIRKVINSARRAPGLAGPRFHWPRGHLIAAFELRTS
jgi:hypothetical protein